MISVKGHEHVCVMSDRGSIEVLNLDNYDHDNHCFIWLDHDERSDHKRCYLYRRKLCNQKSINSFV